MQNLAATPKISKVVPSLTLRRWDNYFENVVFLRKWNYGGHSLPLNLMIYLYAGSRLCSVEHHKGNQVVQCDPTGCGSDETSDVIYCMDRPRRPWGDYGSMLYDGVCRRSSTPGMLAVERTGPFIPPITFPSGAESVLVVTDAMKSALVESKLTGIQFAPVEKSVIVELHWEKWDLTAEEPATYPRGGEPERYILGKRHSFKASEAMGDLWRIVLEDSARLEPVSTPRRGLVFQYVLGSWTGNDIFSVNSYSAYCSSRARDWFKATFPGCCKFTKVPPAP